MKVLLSTYIVLISFLIIIIIINIITERSIIILMIIIITIILIQIKITLSSLSLLDRTKALNDNNFYSNISNLHID